MANLDIFSSSHQDRNKKGMVATIVACVIAGREVIIAHVGDSRAYLWREGKLRCLTTDHLYITEWMGVGETEARTHKMKHMLSRALGVEEAVQIDLSSMAWEPLDVFLLCSDGLVNALSEEEMVSTFTEYTPQQQLLKLLHLAKVHEAEDNTTATIVQLCSQNYSTKLDDEIQGGRSFAIGTLAENIPQNVGSMKDHWAHNHKSKTKREKARVVDFTSPWIEEKDFYPPACTNEASKWRRWFHYLWGGAFLLAL
jgi:serine/threonine protein phosphatase PrpC